MIDPIELVEKLIKSDSMIIFCNNIQLRCFGVEKIAGELKAITNCGHKSMSDCTLEPPNLYEQLISKLKGYPEYQGDASRFAQLKESIEFWAVQNKEKLSQL
jgi:hypothetical protein